MSHLASRPYLKQSYHRLSATGVQRGTEIFTYPNQLAINGVNFLNDAIQAHAPGCIKYRCLLSKNSSWFFTIDFHSKER